MPRRVAAPLCLGLASLAFGAAPAAAQLPFVQADRPGVATPPTLIPRGTVQVEGGVEFRRETGGDDEPDQGTLELPDLLVRFGVLEWLELRLEADGLLHEFRDGAGDRTLGSDLELAAKLGLLEQRRFLPKTSLLLALSLPVGSEPVTSDGFDPTLEGLYEWELGEETVVVVNTGFSGPTQGSDDDRRIFEFDPRIALERQLTEGLGAFIEYYGEIKTGGVADEHSMDGGVSLRTPGRRVQFDVSGGGGLNSAAPDWFVGAGVSMRFSAPWAR